MGFRNRFLNLPIRFKLFISYSIVFGMAMVLTSFFIYFLVRYIINNSIDNELKPSTSTILNIVKTSADTSIKAYLNGIAVQNRNMALYFYNQYKKGVMSELKARQMATQVILNQPVGQTGYSYIVDSNENIIIHPMLSQKDLDQKGSDQKRIDQLKIFERLETVCKLKNGQLAYQVESDNDGRVRNKLVIFHYIKELDWIVVSSALMDEVYAPLKIIKIIFFVTLFVVLLVVLFLLYIISNSIINPLNTLMDQFSRAAKGDTSVRVKPQSNDEVGMLGKYFNLFMAQLEQYSQSLDDEIAEQKKMKDLMVQSEKMKTIAGLSAGMAHEINNPIGCIVQSAQNILRRVSPELEENKQAAQDLGTDLSIIRAYLEKRQIIKFLEDIRINVERTTRTVSNMLSFSRKKEPAKTLVDLATLIDSSLGLASYDYELKKKYDFKSIKIIQKIDPHLRKTICFPSEIEQVIFNLLKNAAQAIWENKNKQVQPMITIHITQSEKFVTIMVEDNGPGMDKDVRERIFEPFFTTRSIGSGTGLGLSVAYYIVTRNHNGTFTVKSEPGHGAIFTITLPCEA